MKLKAAFRGSAGRLFLAPPVEFTYCFNTIRDNSRMKIAL